MISLSLSAGVIRFNVSLGRVLSIRSTSAMWTSATSRKSVPLGNYRRMSPLVFSLLPRCHGECGSQKNTPQSVATVNSAWLAISAP